MDMRRELKRIGGGLVDLILPPRCPCCREIVSEPGRFCGDCFSDLSFITAPHCAQCGLPFEVDVDREAVCGDCSAHPKPYRRARAAYRYDGSIIPLVLGFKHAGRTHLARQLAPQMARFLHDMDDVDLIVPVPLDRRRLLKRGYNQAALLTRRLSRLSGIPLDVEGLIRVKPTRSTAGLSRAGRFRAAQGAFRANGTRLAGRRVLLVDDVMTTGATAEAASKAILRGGAASVDVLTATRAIAT